MTSPCNRRRRLSCFSIASTRCSTSASSACTCDCVRIRDQAAHHRDALDQLGDALNEQEREADHDQRFGRPLRQAAGIAGLLVDLERAQEERYAGDDHDDGQRQQEEDVPDEVDDVAHPLRQHAVDDVDADMLVVEQRPGEHSRKTTLNSTHCSSSQELEEVSNVLRTIALSAEMMTASRISHARRLPVQRVNASIPRLKLQERLQRSVLPVRSRPS